MSRKPRTWHYGYQLSKETGLKSGTLYPLLIRLSDQDMLESQWQEPESPGKPPRHTYRLTSNGLALARAMAMTRKPAIVRNSVIGATA
jgi:PadR family transcriptional regulator